MIATPRPMIALRRCLAALALVLGLTGCEDDGTMPSATLLTEETHGSLMLASTLPSPTSLAEWTDLQAELSEDLERWLSSWDAPPDQGEDVRAGVYGRISAPLAGELGRTGVRGALASLGEAVTAAEELPLERVDPAVRSELARARSLHEEGVEALEEGRRVAGLEHAFRGSDALRAVGPESIARALLTRAEDALEVAHAAFGGEAGEAMPDRLYRADRLARGAHMALDDGDWERALRRAFYACQLLGVPVGPGAR